jgi:predicted transcriptional regulator
MKTTLGVADFESVSKRSLERARLLAKRKPIKAERRVTFARPRDLAAFLTSSRHHVLQAVMQKPRPVADLAHDLDRTRAAVSRDVNALEQLGLVRIHRVPGGIVKAVARKIELRSELSA